MLEIVLIILRMCSFYSRLNLNIPHILFGLSYILLLHLSLKTTTDIRKKKKDFEIREHETSLDVDFTIISVSLSIFYIIIRST